MKGLENWDMKSHMDGLMFNFIYISWSFLSLFCDFFPDPLLYAFFPFLAIATSSIYHYTINPCNSCTCAYACVFSRHTAKVGYFSIVLVHHVRPCTRSILGRLSYIDVEFLLIKNLFLLNHRWLNKFSLVCSEGMLIRWVS